MGSTPLSEGIDRVTLTPIVRRALGSATAEILDWRLEIVYGGVGGIVSGQSSGIYRLAGTAQDGDHTGDWSVILKASQVGSDEPASNAYWRRELLTYRSGILDDLPVGLAAPRCFGAAETGPHETWLWLEDVADAYGGAWPLPRYVLAARHLGQTNGAYLAGRPLPDAPWLSSGWLRRHLGAMHAPAFRAYPALRGHPLVLRGFADGIGVSLLERWAEREAYLEALDRLPRTLCHLDAFRRNLFARRRVDGVDETVVVDWAFVGVAGIGEELAPLVWASAASGDIEASDARELSESAFAAYVGGLRDAGWSGDERLARFGFVTASALRYALLPMPVVVASLDDERRAQGERAWGQTAEEYVDRWIERQRVLSSLADEVRTLLPLVG